MTTIPLNKLIAGRDNIRKTNAETGIGELAASIAAHGLLQSLVVRKTSRGKFAVIAGQRRHCALSRLANDGNIPSDMPIQCHVVSDTADATEIGLAENVVRVPMHPADQFEAFRDLIGKGSTPADVAARFGVSESVIVKRLKLGRVSPAILAAYRDGEMSTEQVQAFAVTDDHAVQERTWTELPEWSRTPAGIREALTEGEIPATDKRVRLVTLDAYEAEGGAVRRDLFDERTEVYVLDVEILNQLVLRKLEAAAETVRAEGWKWTEIQPELDYAERSRCRRCYPEQAPLPEAEASEWERLTAECDELTDVLENDPENAEAAEHLAAFEERIEALENQQKIWSPETKAIAGAIVTVSHSGDIEVDRGFLRPEDAVVRPGASSLESRDVRRSAAAMSATLLRDLTAQKTAAIAAELAGQPGIALAAVTHAFALRISKPA